MRALTKREKEVFIKVALGYTNKEIAKLLNVAIGTVENHRFMARLKSEARNSTDILRYVSERGWINVE